LNHRGRDSCGLCGLSRGIHLVYIAETAVPDHVDKEAEMPLSVTTRATIFAILLTFAGFVALVPSIALAGSALPPAIGPSEPRVAPVLGDDHLYHQKWFVQSFLNLREDFADAKASGRRLAVIFEQRGCGYCTKMHKEVLSERYINDFVRQHFAVIQLNLWGDREITDFDGTQLTEKKLAERWGILFTPTIVFLKEDLGPAPAASVRDLEVLRMGLGIGPGTFYDMFTWIAFKVYKRDRNFQRFHLARYEERKALAEKAAKAGAQTETD